MRLFSRIFGGSKKAPVVEAPVVEKKEELVEEPKELRIPLSDEQVRVLEEIKILVELLEAQIKDAFTKMQEPHYIGMFAEYIDNIIYYVGFLMKNREEFLDKNHSGRVPRFFKEVINNYALLLTSVESSGNYNLFEDVFIKIESKISEFENSLNLQESVFKKRMESRVSRLRE